ncbi:MAG TPA: c-type cytochrome [Azospirillum sp.]|nr:c-type cytochrome [Azospirillum sp.]
MSKKLLMGAALLLGMTVTAGGAQAAGDAAAGKDVFKECMACHTVEAGKNKVGPSLAGVVGRKAGAIEGFRYSKPMQEKAAAGFTWTPENLKAYFEAPKEVVPGGTMAYAGLKNVPKYKANADKAAEDLIAFLAEQK